MIKTPCLLSHWASRWQCGTPSERGYSIAYLRSVVLFHLHSIILPDISKLSILARVQASHENPARINGCCVHQASQASSPSLHTNQYTSSRTRGLHPSFLLLLHDRPPEALAVHHQHLQHAESWSSPRLCADDAAQSADKKIDKRHRSQSYHSLEHTRSQ